jgi:hypothetical protein
MSLRDLAAKRITKEIKFMGESVKISKLTVAEVIEIQEHVKATENNDNKISILRLITDLAVEGASDLTEEEFRSFPMEELNRLSEEVMKFSGVGGQGK